ncbi:MAG: hypothetical protein AAF590_12630 [Pseudomonadota bacterium]
MKTLALATIAAALTVGATAGNAFADPNDFDRAVDATVISADADSGILMLDNGWTLDSNTPHFAFPNGASAGDKVRVQFDGIDSNLRSVRVIG